MKLFMLFMVVSIAAALWLAFFYPMTEPLIVIALLDLMATWFFFETHNISNGRSALRQKIEALEMLTSNAFEKINAKINGEKSDKKELVKWLDKF